jgi:ABC-2 type transport system ATP-binding protein
MKTAILVKQLVKKYDGHTVLKSIDLAINEGEIFALLGANGAGKTTTLECIEGIRKYESGEISVLGYSSDDPVLRTLTGIQLQSSSLPSNITAQEALTLFCKWQKVPAKLEILGKYGLKELYNKQYRTMSTGQKRRLHLALAIAHDPKVIFLDEPTAGLDVEGRAAIHADIREMKKAGKTVILASHDMAEVEALCDRIAIIINGKITFIGSPSELSQSNHKTFKISIKTASKLQADDLKFSRFECEKDGYSIFSANNMSNSVMELLQYAKSLGNEVLDLRIDHTTLEESLIDMIKEGKAV